MTLHDTAAAVSFFRNLEPEGPWLIIAINPLPQPGDKRSDHARFLPGQETELAAWIDRYQGRWNLYYTSNLPAWDPFLSAKKEAVVAIRLLHVDLDLPGDATDEELTVKLLDDLRSLEPPPTGIVFTGGGYQGFWKLAERLSVEHLERVEGINTALWKLLGGDHCHDVSRLLRLPGTVNVPNARKAGRGRVPAAARLIEVDWSRTWSFHTDPVPRFPEDREPLPKETAPRTDSGVLATLPSKLSALIRSGDPSNFANDRSRLGWYVMCELLRRGWTDEDLTKLFLDPTYGISAHYLEQPNGSVYVARNLVRAHDAVRRDWNRHPRSREILTKDQENIDKALEALGVKLSYDQLADRAWINGVGPAKRLGDDEVDEVWLRVQRECGWLPDQGFFKTVFVVRAREKSFHPVLDYLERVQPTWDGVPRIGNEPLQVPGAAPRPSWLTRYGGVEDTPYTRAVGRLTLVAAVRRMRHPGCKFDEMLMLIDPTQGTNKSTAVRTLAVNDDWFNDYLPIGETGREVIEAIRGYWIIEAQELVGMSTRDVERTKAFCSRQHDRGRMSYDKLTTDLPRCCVFIGTANDDTLFTDLLNRRYWPQTVTREFDIVMMRRELDQLWAEAAQAEATGEPIRLARELWPAATEVQARYRVEESWATLIDGAIGHLNGRITSTDLYRIINKAQGSVLHNDGRRLGRAMREIGFERRQVRDGRSPNPRWYYLRGKTEEEQMRDIFVFRDPTTNDLEISNDPPTMDSRTAADAKIPF